jgi:hypothetical protein
MVGFSHSLLQVRKKIPTKNNEEQGSKSSKRALMTVATLVANASIACPKLVAISSNRINY